MQAELEIQTQDDAERELDENLRLIYRQYGGKLTPFFDRVRAIEDAKDEIRRSSVAPELDTLAARVKAK